MLSFPTEAQRIREEEEEEEEEEDNDASHCANTFAHVSKKNDHFIVHTLPKIHTTTTS